MGFLWTLFQELFLQQELEISSLLGEEILLGFPLPQASLSLTTASGVHLASLKCPWLPSVEHCLDPEAFFLLFVKMADSSCKLVQSKQLPGTKCLWPSQSQESSVGFSEGFFVLWLCGRMASSL